jgi:hypothetical protein
MIEAAQGRIHTLACIKGIPVHSISNTPFDLYELHSSGTPGCENHPPWPILGAASGGEMTAAGISHCGGTPNRVARPLRELRHDHSSDANAPADAVEGILCLIGASGAGDTRPVQREARTSKDTMAQV